MNRSYKRKVLKITAVLGLIGLLAGLIFLGIHGFLKYREKESGRALGCQLVHSMKRNELLTEADLAVFEYDKGTGESYLTAAQAEGTRLIRDTAEGMRLMEDSVYEGEPITDDMRLHKYTFITLTERMKKGDYIDIRISFPNGADFVLLSKKQIQDITWSEEGVGENAIWLHVSEEEILRLSSAAVEAFLNDGCSIYAVMYIEKNQKAAIMNYKVNDVVAQLIEDDPNIVEKAENVLEWQIWNEWKDEGNSLSVNGGVGEMEIKEKTEESFEETAEDEIIYFD